jgi:hypothetical protein
MLAEKLLNFRKCRYSRALMLAVKSLELLSSETNGSGLWLLP